MQPILSEVLAHIHILDWTSQVNHIFLEANFWVEALAMSGYDAVYTPYRCGNKSGQTGL